MKLWHWVALSGATIGVFGAGMVARTFLPPRLIPQQPATAHEGTLCRGQPPEIEVSFLRCGSNSIPACFAVQGRFSLAPHPIAYSAVLVRHPKGTFLYDTGLSAAIPRILKSQPFWFRTAFRTLVMQQSIAQHLELHGLRPQELDFVLLSHLHWDHVSGIPDLPGVSLRIHSVEYAAAQQKILYQYRSLVQRLLCDNPIELFDLTDQGYAGFPASYDLFGDGSIQLLPLPGHTDGQIGMLIQRANGGALFLIADAVWFSENYLTPAPMHPLIWRTLASDAANALQTLLRLHTFARQHPDIPMIAMHDATMQDKLINGCFS